MRAAVCQLEIKFENIPENLARAEDFMQTAARNGADIIFFPEMSFTGFSANTELTADRDGGIKERLRAAAKRFGIGAGFGVTELRDGLGENHYMLYGADGRVISDYIKLHSFLYGGEEGFVTGNSVATADFRGHGISTFICYDLRFPEIFRACAEKSDIMVVAANWPQSRSAHWKALLTARAIENQAYVIGVNCVGRQRDIYYGGDSRVIAPSGEIISTARRGKEELLYADIGNEARTLRESFPALRDRRTELYREIL